MSFFKDLVLSVDIDGVLVDNFPVWKAFFESGVSPEHPHLPEKIPFNEAPHWDYFYNICQTCFNQCISTPQMVKGYSLTENAKETLTLLKELGAKIHVVSARPDAVIEATHEWVKDVLGDIVDSTHVTNNKLEVCSALGVKYHVDDAPHQLRAFESQDKIVPIVWSYPYNLGSEGPRVKTWTEYASLILFKEHY